jgi:3-oxoadipate enol-lactonase
MQAGRGFDVCEQLGTYLHPSLVLAGSEDGLIDPKAIRQLADHFRRSEFVEINGAGHMLTVERPGQFYSCLDGFLRVHFPSPIDADQLN